MTLKIVRTPAARIDLLDIWTYIADDSERAAELGPGLRSAVAGRYVLFCRVQGDELLLVRALSGYLDITPDDFA